MAIRYEENRIKNMKEEIKKIILWMMLWGIGYCTMWFAKWLLAAIILKVNSLDYVIDNAMLRINGNIQEKFVGIPKEKSYLTMGINAIKNNLLCILGVEKVKVPVIKWSLIISSVLFLVTFIKKYKKEILTALMILAIGLVPFCRFLILASHSKSHYLFTFRALIATFISIIVAVYIGIDKNKFKKEIKEK